MQAFVGNIEELTINNHYYRKVLHTTENQQLVVMSLLPWEEIGMEVHPKIDQFFRIEQGSGKLDIQRGNEIETDYLHDGISIMIPMGTMHNITAGPEGLKLYTIYSKPNHPIGLVQPRKPLEEDHD